MTSPCGAECRPGEGVLSDRLNQHCLCTTLDRTLLQDSVGRAANDPAFNMEYLESRPNLLSNVAVFLSSDDIVNMRGIVEAIEAATRLSGYQSAVLAWAPEIALRDFGPVGAFMGYDFHLDDSGPKLIEVNTNAGGAFINALLAKAQTRNEPSRIREAADHLACRSVTSLGAAEITVRSCELPRRPPNWTSTSQI